MFDGSAGAPDSEEPGTPATDPGKDYVASSHGTFTRARGIAEYVHAFDGGVKGENNGGGRFSGSLKALKERPDGRWLDSGAGEGLATAQVQSQPGAERLTATLVSFKTSALPGPQRRVLSGRFLQDIPQEELGKNHLITDVIGILAYTFDFMRDLRSLVTALEDDGELYVFLGTSKNDFYGRDNKVVANGRVHSLGDYLATIPGLDVELVKTKLFDNIDGSVMGEVWNARIRRIPGTEPRWPELETLVYREGDRAAGEMVPQRLFAVKGAAPLSPTDIERLAADALPALAGRPTDAESFFDRFRGWTAFSNPLLMRLARLGRRGAWSLSGPAADQVGRELRSGDLRFGDPSFFRPARWLMNAISRLVAPPAQGQAAPVVRVIDDPSAFLRLASELPRWLESTPPGGEVWLSLGLEHGGTGTGVRILTRDGRRVGLRSWLAEVPGLRVRDFSGHRVRDGGGRWVHEENVFVRVAVARGGYRLPELELIGAGEPSLEGVPVPLYREITPDRSHPGSR